MGVGRWLRIGPGLRVSGSGYRAWVLGTGSRRLRAQVLGCGAGLSGQMMLPCEVLSSQLPSTTFKDAFN